MTVAQPEGNPLLEHEMSYLARGLPIFPVCSIVAHTHPGADGRPVQCAKPGKVPLVRWKEFQERLPSEPEVFGWHRRWPEHNIGMATGHLSRVVVIDLDGDLAIQSARAHGYANGPHAFTGRIGGQHRFFQWRPDAPRNFVAHDGIDYRGEGGYVILPPSHHYLGRQYRWGEELTDPQDLPVLPEWVDVMSQIGTRTRLALATDTGEVIAEGQRNSRLASIGGALRRYGADEDAILTALMDVNARQCQPPLPADEVYVIARSVARYAPEPDDAPRIRLHPLQKAERQQVQALDYLTAYTLEDAEEEEVTWFAYGLAAAGLVTELDGKVKQAGKTTLLLAMARAILQGESFLGSSTSYTPILYLSEQSITSFKRNVRRAGLLGREDFHLLLWASTRGWSWPDLVEDVKRHMAETGARLLIVDTLAQFSKIRGDDENKSGAAMLAMEPLQALAAAGIGVLVCRHDRKSGGEVGDSGRGSSAYAGTADVVLHLQRVEDANRSMQRQRVLDGLSRFEETPEKLLIELTSAEPYTYTALGDVADVRDRRVRIDILSCLPTTEDDALTEKDLQELLEVKAVDLRRVLRRLVDEGEVIRIGSGQGNRHVRDPYRYYQRVWAAPDV